MFQLIQNVPVFIRYLEKHVTWRFTKEIMYSIKNEKENCVL